MIHTTPAQHAGLVLHGWTEDAEGDYWHTAGAAWIWAPGNTGHLTRHPTLWTLSYLTRSERLYRRCPLPLAIEHANRTEQPD